MAGAIREEAEVAEMPALEVIVLVSLLVELSSTLNPKTHAGY
jgi:hypothetical protein